MTSTETKFDVYLEVGSKRTIAAALEWPGWCRIGRDEQSALAALVAYGTRYGKVAHAAQLPFTAPASVDAFTVVERLKGSSMTDFGAPEAIPAFDEKEVDEADLRRLRALLRASWRAFDQVVEEAEGKTLQKGPRGGGRELDHIVEHVLEADVGHLSRLGRKFVANAQESSQQSPQEQLARLRAAMLDALEAGAAGEIAERGSRGGKRAPLRFVIRRSLWHVLDHVWEIEDRALGG